MTYESNMAQGEQLQPLRVGPRFTMVERGVRSGTRLAIYSDGIVEQWDQQGASFGLGPPVEALRSKDPIAATLANLEARLNAFLGGRDLADDATVVALCIA